jgi:hypothetical protein
MSLEAMKQALEALESDNPDIQLRAAIALRQSIEQAEQAEKAQPKCGAIIEVFGKDWRLEYMSLPVGKHKLYTQQYEYTAPPQRKPLTDEETCRIKAQIKGTLDVQFVVFARAIEAAHGIKEKNT